MRYIIKEDQRGLLFKDGNYTKLLPPGKYFFSGFMDYSVVVLSVDQPFTVPDKNITLFLKDEALLKELDVVDVKDNELCLHYENNKFTNVYKSGKYAFWNVLTENRFKIVDIMEPEISEKDIDIALFNNQVLSPYLLKVDVASYETGLVFYNGELKRELGPGKYYYWNGPVSITAQKVDMRRQQLDVAGQEIMTADKVTLRLNFVCHYKITNPRTAILEIKSYQDQIYILMQLILREYVGELRLDELLKKKQELGDYVIKKLKDNEAEFGLEFVFAGLKDVILPGDVKDILNTVLIAEKKAQANTITRREETASTRSLLNTAKLMDENQTLYRLKELEYLEKICDKIGTISLNSNTGLLECLNSLLTQKVESRK